MALLGKFATVTCAISWVAPAPDLKRDAGVLGVLLGGVVWMGAATAPAAQATCKVPKLGT
jgi:hypothetical protein